IDDSADLGQCGARMPYLIVVMMVVSQLIRISKAVLSLGGQSNLAEEDDEVIQTRWGASARPAPRRVTRKRVPGREVRLSGDGLVERENRTISGCPRGHLHWPAIETPVSMLSFP